MAAPPHVPNSVAPNQLLGVLIKVQGGVGQGQVLFKPVAITHEYFETKQTQHGASEQNTITGADKTYMSTCACETC